MGARFISCFTKGILSPAGRHPFLLMLLVVLTIQTPNQAQSQKINLLKDIETKPTSSGSNPTGMTKVGNTIFFLGTDQEHGTELWKTDGTESGTVLVKDLNPNFGVSSQITLPCCGAQSFVNDGSKIFFKARDGTLSSQGQQTYGVWVSDGTASGTFRMTSPEIDIQDVLYAINGSVYYSFYQPTPSPGRLVLYRTDGTAPGTIKLKEMNGINPTQVFEFNGAFYFMGLEFDTNTSDAIYPPFTLWKTDGTANGTVAMSPYQMNMVLDKNSTNPSILKSPIVIGSSFFLPGSLYDASNVSSGPEILKCDGSSVSVVKDIVPGPGGNATSLLKVGNEIFFRAFTDAEGEELWKTNGTGAGTIRVKDIQAGVNSSAITNPTVVGSKLFFYANDGVNGAEPWVSDGTEPGTIMLNDINTGVAQSYFPSTYGNTNTTFVIGSIGNTLYFNASTATGSFLYKTDGTTLGTVPVTGVQTDPNFSVNFGSMRVAGTNVFFQRGDNTNGQELWKTDGTTTGMVKDIFPGLGCSGTCPNSSGASPLFALGNILYLTAFDGTTGSAWSSDGTVSGTNSLGIPGLNSPNPTNTYTEINGSFVFKFSATGLNPNVVYVGDELFITNGTASGTKILKDISGSGDSRLSIIQNPTQYGGGWASASNLAFYFAQTQASGIELYKTDGTSTGTSITKDIFTGITGSIANGNLVTNPVTNTAFFKASDSPLLGDELWKSDGTSLGTVMVKNINVLNNAGSNVSSLTMIDGVLYFSATTAGAGAEFWKSDGTDAGTVMVKDINPGPNHSSPTKFVKAGSNIFFIADNGIIGQELWVTNGTSAGTLMVKDINPTGITFDVNNLFFVAVGNALYFQANDGVNGNELWKSDGTQGGTVLVKDIFPGSGSSGPRLLTELNGKVYFAATGSSAIGEELWSSDGSDAGTTLVLDVTPGSNSSAIREIVGTGNLIYFNANHPAYGDELWKSDGTVDGTVLVKDINISGQSIVGSFPKNFSAINGTLYFNAVNPYGSLQLFKTNGTPEGTLEVSTGPVYTYDPAAINYFKGNVYFSARSSEFGDEIFYAMAEPLYQPTSLVLDERSPNSLKVTFSVAQGSPNAPSGYLVLRRAANQTTDLPVDGLPHTVGASIGQSKVAYIGSGLSFTDNSLLPDTQYFYSVFSYNNDGSANIYRPSNPLKGSVSTLAAEPTISTSSLVFSDIQPTSATVTVSGGNGSSKILIARKGSAVSMSPLDGTTYSANSIFGSGSELGTGNFVVGIGSGSFSLTGLSSSSQYYFAVYEFNGNNLTANFLTTSGLTGDVTTLAVSPGATPTNLAVIQDVNKLTLSWTPPSGNPSGYLVIRKTISSPSGVPDDANTYTVGSALGDGTIAYVGAATTFDDTGLNSATQYYYDIFVFNGQGISTNYLPTPLEGNKFTLVASPSDLPSAITISNVTSSSFTASFTASTANTSGYITLLKQGGIPTFTPADGEVYVKGSTVGDASVANVGTEVAFSIANLTPGTEYSLIVFPFNGSGNSTNYLSGQLTNFATSFTTPTAPLVSQATSIDQTKFTANWATVTGASSYRLDVALDNLFTIFSTGNENRIVNGTSVEITSLSPGATYFYRLRAVNSGGVSQNSLVNTQITVAQTPVVTSSDVSQVGLTLNWSEVIGASSYRLDLSSTLDFGNILAGFNDKVLTGTSFKISGLSSGVTYYARLRSVNSGGTSLNSEVKSQITIPITPIVPQVATTDKTITSFKVKWEPSLGADSYELYVAKDDIPLAGYNPKLISGSLEEIISGLSQKTIYKFQVRAKNVAGVSPYSAFVFVETNDQVLNPLAISQPIVTGFKISVTLSLGSGSRIVKFLSKGILAPTSAFVEKTLTSTTDTYETTIAVTDFDELGLEYYFTASDVSTTTFIRSPSSKNGFISSSIAKDEKLIPNLSSGGKLENYRIISVPYKLEDNLVSSIFGGFGDHKVDWRLMHYEGGKNKDFPAFPRIEQGKGYWFNTIKDPVVKIGVGSAPENNKDNPFTLPLAKEWNQIGNPFPFDVKWSAVLAANPGVAVGKLKVYDPASATLKESDELKMWSGGFVLADNAASLTFPVALKNGRVSETSITSKLDEAEWFVPLTLTYGIGENNEIGFGMHPQASTSKDRYDDVAVPRFFNYLEFTTKHDEFFVPNFGRDVVPTIEQYTWNFTMNSNLKGENVSLSWNPAAFGTNEAQLLLFDIDEQVFINMRSVNHYSFTYRDNRSFKFLYSSDERTLNPDFTMLGKPYPNPASQQVTVPIVVRENQTQLTIEVIDLMGRKVKVLAQGEFTSGIHDLNWGCDDEQLNKVGAGIYLIQMKQNKGASQMQKVVVR